MLGAVKSLSSSIWVLLAMCGCLFAIVTVGLKVGGSLYDIHVLDVLDEL